ncbi:MAG: cytochrome C [Paracoccaceae bacterium]
MRNTATVFSLIAALSVSFLVLGNARTGDAQEASGDAPAVPPPYVMPQSGPFHPERIAVENAAAIAAWSRSGHSDAAAEAFAHWNEDGEIPAVCSVCHSGAGFRAFHGLDGSAPGLPENPMPIGGVVDCETCHSPKLSSVTEIRFPSGIAHPVSAAEAACLTCHQGRAAGATVAKAIGTRGDDTPDPELGFVNPHYATAAATWLGGYGGAGYHYPGKEYSGRFFHARPLATCASCHEPHSLEVASATCGTCHENATPREIRLSRQSYDGSGNLSVGIRSDILGNADRLMQLLKEYAAGVAGTAMVYDGHRHPYFFADANGDGQADQAEGKPVAYNAWTPRLLRAAFNWKLVTADPGAYAHNPHYALELLYDSTEDLAQRLGLDVAAMGIRR